MALEEEMAMTCDNPEPVPEFLKRKANGRKLRWFAAVSPAGSSSDAMRW